MRILLFGATGQIGRLLVPKLLEDGHKLSALVRDLKAASDLKERGVQLIEGDLEQSFENAVGRDYDAVVFTAGSGASTGKDKTLTVDLWGAIQTVRFCEQSDISRYIMISALKAQNPNRGKDAIKPYLAAKHAADEILKASKLDYTILRPGRLTDEAETGRIRAAAQMDDYNGATSRANVAESIRHCLNEGTAKRKTIDLLDGDTSVTIALSALNELTQHK